MTAGLYAHAVETDGVHARCKAIEHFNEALDIDPVYALAYAGLADCYVLSPDFGVLPPEEAYPKGEAAAHRAIELDESVAEAHASLAFVLRNHRWNWAASEREFKRAIELNPNYATAHHWYSLYLAQTGRTEEALAEIDRARELDPLSLVIKQTKGWIFYFGRQNDSAIDEALKTIELNENFPTAYALLGAAYERKGMHDAAIAELRKAWSLSDKDPKIVAALAYTCAVSGRREEAQQLIDELNKLSKGKSVSPYLFALIHTGLGDDERAIRFLEDAYEQRSNFLVDLKVDPRLDQLRADARFTGLLRRIGFPE